MSTSAEKIWFEDIRNILGYSLFPSSEASKSKNLNAVTRFVLFSSIVMFCVKEKQAGFIILIIGLVIILATYSNSIIESFNCDPKYKEVYKSVNDRRVQRVNSSLMGSKPIGLPLTRRLPPMPPQSLNIDHWKDNEWTQHSGTNTRPVQIIEDSDTIVENFRSSVFRQPILANLGLIDKNQSILREKQTRTYNCLDDAYRPPVKQERLETDTLSSRYTLRNHLSDYDVDRKVPLYQINRDATEAHIENSNLFRTEMQAILMRKRNAEAWQRKEYPISTNHQRMLGSR